MVPIIVSFNNEPGRKDMLPKKIGQATHYVR